MFWYASFQGQQKNLQGKVDKKDMDSDIHLMDPMINSERPNWKRTSLKRESY